MSMSILSNDKVINDLIKKYKEFVGDGVNPETGEVDTNKAKQNALNKKDKLNILLIGATGVGKSSLLNAVFGKDIVKAGVGEPVTQYLEKIHIPLKGLTLWDTKGIEAKDYENTFNQLKQDIDNALNSTLTSRNGQDLPHIAWLCIKESSGRVQESDLELLKLMQKHDIPTVVVFTSASKKKAAEEFFQKAKEIIDAQFATFMKGRYARVNSVAETEEIETDDGVQTITRKVWGVEELIEMTHQIDTLAAERVQALLKAQMVNHEKKLQAMIDGATEKVNYAMAAAAATGAIPIPFSDMILLAGIQTTMIYQINTEFEIDDEFNSITSTLMGIAGTTALGSLGKSLVGSLLKFIPGAGSMAGAAISGTVAATLTKSVGEAYIQVLKAYYNMDTGKVEIPAGMVGVGDMFKTIYEQKKLENK